MSSINPQEGQSSSMHSLFSTPALGEHVGSMLEPKDLISMRRVCQATQKSVNKYLKQSGSKKQAAEVRRRVVQSKQAADLFVNVAVYTATLASTFSSVMPPIIARNAMIIGSLNPPSSL